MSRSFADLGVPAPIVSSLAARRIDAPFPIQEATIPDGLAGRDLCGRAPTGSGKTIAFGIPMVVALGEGSSRPKRPRGLVLVPTRELAAQVSHELQLLSKPRGPWVESFYGGVGFDKQVRALQRGVDIMVACPGRLADLINQRLVALDEVQFVVIDEADRMADMGFLPEVRRLLDQCSTERQTVLFSATLDGDVDVLIKQYQRDPAKHELFHDDEGGARAEHLFWRVERADRLKTAAAIVDKLGPTVVFCRTKRGADRIAKQLDALGVKAAAIHGDRSQKQREFALAQFHRGRVAALVATDVAARGIHVDNVAGVIHYDPPGDPKDYVHRSGRTARAGARGVVISLVPAELRKAVADIQKTLGYPVGLVPADVASLEAGAPSVPSTYTDDERGPNRPTRPSRTTGRTNARPTARPNARPTGHTAARRGKAWPRTDGAPVVVERPARVERPAPAERPAPVERPAVPVPAAETRPPLAEGQRRPSGAARRKAKKLAAAERARTEVDAEGWTRDDLFDGRSGRPAKPTSTTTPTSRAKSRPQSRPTSQPASRAKARPKSQAKAGGGRGKSDRGRTPAAPRSRQAARSGAPARSRG